jgi:xylulokinase
LLEQQAEKAPPGSEGLYFLPYLTGERSPYPDPYARGAWVGLTARTTRAMMIRALLEGVTYAMADQIKIMRQINVKIGKICATGGGGASKWWRQLQADIYRTQVYTINASAGAAYGVAILAMVGAGEYKTVAQACSNAIKVVTNTKPNPKMVALYKKYYALYPNLYYDLKDDFANMAKLVKH